MVIQTFTGKKFDPLNPNINDFCIEDIAHSLSLQCRFTGHCRVFYSVAEHSVHVSYQVPLEHALWGLLHDASEAYLTDLSRPVKRIMPIYKQAEKRLQDLLIPFFNAELPTAQPECVTVADMRMLATERAQIMATGFEWEDLRGIDAYDLTLPCWGPLTAELAFLARFRQLTVDKETAKERARRHLSDTLKPTYAEMEANRQRNSALEKAGMQKVKP